jgi:hypothetical protein
MFVQEALRPGNPPAQDLAITINEMNILELAASVGQEAIPGIARPRCRERCRHVQLHDADAT